MRRREFLIGSSQAALVSCLRPVGAWAQTAGGPGDARSKKLISDVRALIPGLLKETVVPGLSIALVQNGKLLWQQGFGVSDATTRVPVDQYTLFEAASVSKTVFAYAIMKLCEKGVLNLDTPLSRYLPKPFLEAEPQLPLITARHVLSHSTGFQNIRSTDDPLKIHFRPGTRFDYSGEGYYYLQSVLTYLTGTENRNDCSQYEAGLKVCGTDFDPFLKKNLLHPFGMTTSGYLWNNTLARQAAQPHDVSGKRLTKSKPSAPDVARYAAMGGLHTTATEYAKFLIEVLDPKPGDKFRLTKKSQVEMLRPQIKLPADGKIDGADAWALGWAIQQRKTGDVILHSGGQSGFRSLTMGSVKRKSGFVMLTNGDNGGKVIFDPKLGALLNQLLIA